MCSPTHMDAVSSHTPAPIRQTASALFRRLSRFSGSALEATHIRRRFPEPPTPPVPLLHGQVPSQEPEKT